MMSCVDNCKETCGYKLKMTTVVSMNPYPNDDAIPSLTV